MTKHASKYGDAVFMLKGKKKPFESCTTASGELLDLLFKQCHSWQKVLQNINYDEDAKRIATKLAKLEEEGKI